MKQELINIMAKLPSGIDAAIVTSEENRNYLTNMKSSDGMLLFTAKKAYFIIDFRYIEKAKQIITDFDVILQENDIYAQISKIFNENNVKNVAIEAMNTTVQQYQKYCDKLPTFEFSKENSLSEVLEDLRAIKSDDEIAFITKAQEITDNAFLHIIDYIRPGMTELEVQLDLEYTMKKMGASNIAFDSIIVSGVNSSLPHGVPTEKKIEQGDFVTLDFGAAFNNYCSDMTRTVAIGKISDEQKKFMT